MPGGVRGGLKGPPGVWFPKTLSVARGRVRDGQTGRATVGHGTIDEMKDWAEAVTDFEPGR